MEDAVADFLRQLLPRSCQRELVVLRQRVDLAKAPVLGSFFPAWIACLALGLLLTVAAGWLLLRLHVVIALPILTYPSLTALFTFALWLAFFR